MAKTRAERILSRVLAVVAPMLILSAVALAAMQGHSNAPSGTIITKPTGSVVLQLALPGTYYQGQTVVSRANLTNGVGSTITAHVELTMSRPGISSSDVSVSLAGNPPTIISCDSNNCTFVGTSWTIYAGTTSPCDIGVTINVMQNFTWSAVAIWTSP